MLECLTFRDMGGFFPLATPVAVCAEVLYQVCVLDNKPQTRAHE